MLQLKTSYLEEHPCFNQQASLKYVRAHLPVARSCNIQCNYCLKKYGCPNENRPGVTQEILSPNQAFLKIKKIKEKMPELKVVGINGPGDPLANPVETLETLKMVKAEFPQLKLCISTNGLMLKPYLPELLEIGLEYLSVTINSININISKDIYKWVNFNGEIYQGEDAAIILLEKQIEGIKLVNKFKDRIKLKINIVLIPELNDNHITEVVNNLAQLGCNFFNIMPFIPVKGSVWQDKRRSLPFEVNKVREIVEQNNRGIKFMKHCKQCRSDSVGLICDDRSKEFYNNNNDIKNIKKINNKLIAVASKELGNIEGHFGHAEKLFIYEVDSRNTIVLLEERQINRYCHGKNDCGKSNQYLLEEIYKKIKDCEYLLCDEIGPLPKDFLTKQGINVVSGKGDLENIILKTIQRGDFLGACCSKTNN